MILLKAVAFCCALSFVLANKADTQAAEKLLDLTILHINDLHGRFAPIDTWGNECSPEDDKKSQCFGGFGRHVHTVKEFRNKSTPLLFLNAGDIFTGSKWFAVHREQIAYEFMDVLRPDVSCLGNHEFDLGSSCLTTYMGGANFPFVAANLNLTLVPELRMSPYLHASVVRQVSADHRVGIVGYVSRGADGLLPGMGVTDEVMAINDECEKLRATGVRTIIALGHSGSAIDRHIAASCPHVDLVVGAHDHVLMWNGPAVSIETPISSYPLVVTQVATGKRVPVVQAGAYGKYLGVLNLRLASNGSVHSFDGQPLLMDSRVPSDPHIDRLLRLYRPEVQRFDEQIVGETSVWLNGTCRAVESNVGNLITDAMVHAYQMQYNDSRTVTDVESGVKRWTDVTIAFFSGVGIYSGIGNYAIRGNISMADLMVMMPFSNKFMAVWLSGREVYSVLEHMVANYTEDCENHDMLQMSGIRVVFNLTAPVGHRVHSAEVLCTECEVPAYEPMRRFQEYKVIVSDFLAQGRGGFGMIKNKRFIPHSETVVIAVKNYISQRKRIFPAIEGRIQFLAKPHSSAAVGAEMPRSSSSASGLIPGFVFTAIINAIMLF